MSSAGYIPIKFRSSQSRYSTNSASSKTRCSSAPSAAPAAGTKCARRLIFLKMPAKASFALACSARPAPRASTSWKSRRCRDRGSLQSRSHALLPLRVPPPQPDKQRSEAESGPLIAGQAQQHPRLGANELGDKAVAKVRQDIELD